MSKGMLIGTFFVVLGISILLKAFFHINLPIFRTLFALFFIYLGFKILIGGWACTLSGSKAGGSCLTGWGQSDHQSAIFSEGKFVARDNEGATSERRRYSVVFGKGSLDLTQFSPALFEKGKNSIDVEVDTVFGEMTVLVNPALPVSIRARSVFGEARLPDSNQVEFGSMNYDSPAVKPDMPVIRVRGSVVFGALRFHKKSE